MGQGPSSTWEHTERGIIGQNGDLVCDAEDPFECTHLKCNVGKPKCLPGSPAADARTVLEAVTEMAARWRRAKESVRDDEFTRGRMNGYEQAIGLLLGAPQTDVRQAMMDGVL